MRKMTKYVAVIESSHGDLRYDHLQESRESRENSELVVIKTETSSSGEISALHDTGGNKDFGMFLVNDFQAGGTFQITFKDRGFRIISFTDGVKCLLSMTMTFFAASS